MSLLDPLSLPAESLLDLRRRLAQLRGLVLVVGPARSGKSEVLRALLSHMAAPDRVVFEIHDRSSPPLSGVFSVEVDPRLSHVDALQAALRQDIDVVAIDAVRDLSTARAVVECGSASSPLTLAVVSSDTLGTLIDDPKIQEDLTGVLQGALWREGQRWTWTPGGRGAAAAMRSPPS